MIKRFLYSLNSNSSYRNFLRTFSRRTIARTVFFGVLCFGMAFGSGNMRPVLAEESSILVEETKAPSLEKPAENGENSKSKEKKNSPQTSDLSERDALFAELEKQSAILKAQEKVLKIVSEIISPSVVHLTSDSVKRGPRGERIKQHDEGSGIIIQHQDRFFILTNHHVIKDALNENIEIQYFDNRTGTPIRVWYDKETDIAVLEVKEKGLIPAKIGDSNQTDIGDFVLAVGSPFGLNSSVTFGIISAKGRRALNIDANVNLQDFIQTDAAINPGNSGGPLVNLQGEVIAMNTAIASNTGVSAGIAFSIPINMVELIADQLIIYGKAKRAYLGVTLDSTFTPLKAKAMGIEKGNGAMVSDVAPGSPAALGNISIGDVIVTFNKTSVDDEKHLYNLVNLTEIGPEIPVMVYRKGKIYSTTIRLLER